jgi:hypothetical protein
MLVALLKYFETFETSYHFENPQCIFKKYRRDESYLNTEKK